jgi:hypothetical protein
MQYVGLFLTDKEQNEIFQAIFGAVSPVPNAIKLSCTCAETECIY